VVFQFRLVIARWNRFGFWKKEEQHTYGRIINIIIALHFGSFSSTRDSSVVSVAGFSFLFFLCLADRFVAWRNVGYFFFVLLLRVTNTLANKSRNDTQLTLCSTLRREDLFIGMTAKKKRVQRRQKKS
jgi:hypothetical protein